MALRILLLTCAVRHALGHGAMVYPRPRNSIDAFANVSAKDRHTFAHCANITGKHAITDSPRIGTCVSVPYESEIFNTVLLAVGDLYIFVVTTFLVICVLTFLLLSRCLFVCSCVAGTRRAVLLGVQSATTSVAVGKQIFAN